MSRGDDIPGDYDSLEGIKERARALGSPEVVELIERAENRIIEDGDGYAIGYPEMDDEPPSYGLEMTFHLGILTGAAMEREWPAGSVVGSDEP